MKMINVLVPALTLLLAGCASSPSKQLDKLYAQQENERVVQFEETGNCLVLYEFTNISVLKNVGYDSKYLKDDMASVYTEDGKLIIKHLEHNLASAYYEDGKIIIEYKHDSLVLDPSIESMAISSSKKIAAAIKNNALGVGYVRNDIYRCVKNKPSFYVTSREVERLSAMQPN